MWEFALNISHSNFKNLCKCCVGVFINRKLFLYYGKGRVDKMEKRVTYGAKDWAEYVEFRLRNGLAVEERFTLTMLELEIPFEKLGFSTFKAFLVGQVPNLESLLKESKIQMESSVIPIKSTGNVHIGSRVIWFGSDSTTYKGTVKWLGNIERILCAGVFADQKIGSPFPILWKGEKLFDTISGHGLLLRVNELILKADYDQKQTSKLSKTLTRLLRKVTIRERPREANAIDPTLQYDDSQFQQFDVIYPYAVESGPNGLKINDKIVWTNSSGSFIGIVKWLGHLNCQSGLTAAIDFGREIGNCSGTYEGYKLFNCKQNHGRFLGIGSIQKSEDHNQKSTSATHSVEYFNQDLRQCWQRNQYLPRHFKVGDSILYQRDLNTYVTGRIQWLGLQEGVQVAGIQFDAPIRNRVAPTTQPQDLPFESTPGHGDFAPLEKLVLYDRLSPQSVSTDRLFTPKSTTSNAGVRLEELDKNIIEQSISAGRLKLLLGYKKGIQGRNNSCHLDSVLFAIFSCSETFDAHLLRSEDTDSNPEKIMKEILRIRVANPLRKEFYCPASNIEAVEQVLKLRQNSHTSHGKCDEILEALLQNGTNVENPDAFIHYTNESSNYLHRIMASSCNLSENVVTLQDLLQTDFKLQNFQFKSLPTPALILVLPEHNHEVAPSKLIIPNLILELTDLIHDSGSVDLSSPCVLCGEPSTGRAECPDCVNALVSPLMHGSNSNTFCLQCYEAFHQHWTRRNHRKGSPSEKKKQFMELQSIICTRENQSIAFVKCGTGRNGEWIVHDSTFGGTVPQVQNVFSLTECLVTLENDPSSLCRDWNSFIPEIKIILTFAHICIYSPL